MSDIPADRRKWFALSGGLLVILFLALLAGKRLVAPGLDLNELAPMASLGAQTSEGCEPAGNRLDEKLLPPKVGKLWSPAVAWCFSNPEWQGNPFDVVATATFRHPESGEVRRTELFYAGAKTWELRFSGMRTGRWVLETSSQDADLDGWMGEASIGSNPAATGFITHQGHQWTREVGEAGQVEPFVPNLVMAFNEDLRRLSPDYIEQQVEEFLEGHGFNGFFVFLGASWVDINSGPRWDRTNRREPDLRTFDALERLITRTHAAGGIVHLWYVGDCYRQQCAQAAFEQAGARTREERRLLRYIAARLGPLPGWMMGYGYDIPEHASTQELRLWGDTLRLRMGWPHPLGARNQSKERYDLWPEADFFSWGELDWTYEEVRKQLAAYPDRPHMLAERFWQGRMDADQQRRAMWAYTMAGGAGAIWAWERPDGASVPYPNREELHTYARFWQDRFRIGLAPIDDLSDGWAMTSQDRDRFVFYKEDTNTVRMDLSGIDSNLRAVAVDTQKLYAEIEVGRLSPGQHTWEAPYVSDWAIAVEIP